MPPASGNAPIFHTGCSVGCSVIIAGEGVAECQPHDVADGNPRFSPDMDLEALPATLVSLEARR